MLKKKKKEQKKERQKKSGERASRHDNQFRLLHMKISENMLKTIIYIYIYRYKYVKVYKQTKNKSKIYKIYVKKYIKNY